MKTNILTHFIGVGSLDSGNLLWLSLRRKIISWKDKSNSQNIGEGCRTRFRKGKDTRKLWSSDGIARTNGLNKAVFPVDSG